MRTMNLVLCIMVVLITGAYAAQESAAEARIYARLVDKHCGGVMLDKCFVADARVMKAYASALIDAGLKDDEIFYLVGKRFTPAVIVDPAVRKAVEKRLAAEIGDAHPLIVVEPGAHDFGTLSKKDKSAARIFTVRNAGTAPLKIAKLRVSCGCTTANLILDRKAGPAMSSDGRGPAGDVTLAAGGTAELEVIFDLASPAMSIGTVTRTVTVGSNDPLYPEVSIILKARVTK